MMRCHFHDKEERMKRVWMAAAAALMLSACAAEAPVAPTGPVGPVYHVQNGGCTPAPSPTVAPGGNDS
jgi:hypothetical protein